MRNWPMRWFIVRDRHSSGARRSLQGFVELHFIPLLNNVSRLKLNCKQCRISRICVRDERSAKGWYDASFQNEDPCKVICTDVKKRNLDYFLTCEQNAINEVDPETGGGELIIRIPRECMACVMEQRKFRVSIEFSLEKPVGGIQFVIPKGEGTFAQRSAHMFTYSYANTSRLWFPCVDAYSEVCTWNIDVTVDADMVAISSGDLLEQVYSSDEKKKTYHYALNIPTSAPNIALAVGPFEICADPTMPEITNFCLPGLMPALKHATAFLHEVFEFYEEYLSCRYPYTYYKQVFVDQAYDVKAPYASMTVFNTSLLHSHRIIDQTFVTRRVLAQALAEQFFGCYIGMQTWSDSWLPQGIAGYLFGLYTKKAFGNNEYRYWIHKEMQSVCRYEMEGPGLPPLHNPGAPGGLSGASTLSVPSTSSQPDSSSPVGSGNFASLHMHPHLTPMKQKDIACSKSHLVLRMIEMRIGQEPLLQVFNKLLSLANTAAQPKADHTLWSNMLLSTSGFLKSISTVSGKDINVFVSHWVCHSGVAKFHGSFVFNRKRNIVELDIKQDLSKGTAKYVGPLAVCIQELDGSFNHTVQIEDVTSHHELPCHSKSRRHKKKKIPLMTGEEVDMDLNAMDSDSPVLWLRIDPDVTWLRHVKFEQPDFMWQYQLRYERDVIAQSESIRSLEQYPTQNTRQSLIDVINQRECFYRIRLEASECLSRVATACASNWNGHVTMISIFRNMFGSHSCQQIPRYNDFSDFVLYFLEKALPIACSKIRNVHSQCPKEVIQFLLDLIKYNDNRLNKFSDSYYLSSIIEALSHTVTPGVSILSTSSDGTATVKLTDETQQILGEITKYLNLEKLLPSYRYIVTVSCLKTLRVLQTNRHVPADPQAFQYYARFGHFEDIRLAAIDCLVDFTKVEGSIKVFNYLLDIVETDLVPYVRHYVLRQLADNPPFTRKTESQLNTLSLVERLWQFMNRDSCFDGRLRCDCVDLYNALWGRLTPSCVPPQGVSGVILLPLLGVVGVLKRLKGCGIVIDLKERKIMNLSPLPAIGSPAGSVSGEESITSKTSKTSKKSRKRKSSKPPSTTGVPDLSHLDSQPGTPMSMESACSDGSKLKLKFKLGNEESGAESGSEVRSRAGHESGSEYKRHKKKKKKHKHKEDKEKKRKRSTSSSNYDSPMALDTTLSSV